MYVENTDYLGGVLSLAGLCLALYSIISARLIPREKYDEITRQKKIKLLNIGGICFLAGLGIIFQIVMFIIGIIFMALSVILFGLWLKIIMDPEFREVGLTQDPKVPKMKRDAIEQFLVGYAMFVAYFGVNTLENWLESQSLLG